MAREEIINNTPCIIVYDYQELSELGAQMLIDKLIANPYLNFMFSTGTTQLGIYRLLSTQYAHLFQHSRIFGMQEYCHRLGRKKIIQLLNEEDPRSYKRYMKQHVLQSIQYTDAFFPDRQSILEEGAYDNLIIEKGEIDICINSLGADTHTFGFNFPGTPFDSKTRVVELPEPYRMIAQENSGYDTPTHALTIGLQTGMNAREILMVVSGRTKARAVKQALTEDISPEIPASILKQHPNIQWIIDEDAASELF